MIPTTLIVAFSLITTGNLPLTLVDIPFFLPDTPNATFLSLHGSLTVRYPLAQSGQAQVYFTVSLLPFSSAQYARGHSQILAKSRQYARRREEVEF